MLEKGQKVLIDITDMSDSGQGIGRVDGLAVFVDGAVRGDRAEAEITKVKKRYAFAKMTSLQEPSDHRVEPACPYFPDCGGCGLGALDYDGQLALKEDQIRQKLIRLGGIEDPDLEPIISMDSDAPEGPSGFRNKAVLSVSTGGIVTEKGGIVRPAGRPRVGFMPRRSGNVVDCSECLVQTRAVMAAANALRRFMSEEDIPAWDPKQKKGLIRNMIVKTAFRTGEVMVIPVINGKTIPAVEKLVEYLDEGIYEAGYSLESVVLNINREKDGPVMGDKCITIAGKGTILERAGDLSFEISAKSFYQTNPEQMERLYDKVSEYAELSGSETVLDIYCGTGTIGLWLADKADFVIGIESEKQAVLDANRNAVINGITNAAYICGRAEDVLPEAIGNGPGEDDPHDFSVQLRERMRHADVALIDPPRAGCDPALLDAVADSTVRRIVYVSCDPATLARDIKVMTGKGFEFIKAAPVDMFPRSTHVECVALMSKDR